MKDCMQAYAFCGARRFKCPERALCRIMSFSLVPHPVPLSIFECVARHIKQEKAGRLIKWRRAAAMYQKNKARRGNNCGW
jgi:hypothetical protein